MYSDFYRFSAGGLLQGPGIPTHPALGHPLVGSKHDAHHSSHLDQSHRYVFIITRKWRR